MEPIANSVPPGLTSAPITNEVLVILDELLQIRGWRVDADNREQQLFDTLRELLKDRPGTCDKLIESVKAEDTLCGSANQDPEQNTPEEQSEVLPSQNVTGAPETKRRGRPAGSKNKPKEEV